MNGKKILLLFAACCIWLISFAQQPSSFITWRSESPLTWSDFQGAVDVHNKYAALAATGINFSYQAKGRDEVWQLSFTVNSYFDKSQSWGKSDKKTPYLLAHEQLHFDIAELHARKLKRVLDTNKFTKNYKSEIKVLFTAAMADLKKMQEMYDLESDHSKNEEKQQAWFKYIRQELQNYPPTPASASTR